MDDVRVRMGDVAGAVAAYWIGHGGGTQWWAGKRGR